MTHSKMWRWKMVAVALPGILAVCLRLALAEPAPEIPQFGLPGPVEARPLPSGALPLRPPETGEWTIRKTPSRLLAIKEKKRKPEQVESAETNTEKPAYWAETTVQKKRNLRREITVSGNGKSNEIWQLDNLLFQGSGRSVIIVPASTREVAPNADREGFWELGCIQPRFYVGQMRYGDRACWVFARRAVKITSEDEVDTTHYVELALIDAQTRLPVAADDGVYTSEYSFKTGSAPSLQLPPELLQRYEQYQSRLKRTERQRLPL